MLRKILRPIAKRFGIVICSKKCLWSEMHIEHLQAQLERSHKHAESLEKTCFSHLDRLKSFNFIVEDDVLFARWETESRKHQERDKGN